MRPRILKQAASLRNDFRRRRLALDLRQSDVAALIHRSVMAVSKIENHELRGSPAARALASLLTTLEAEQP